MFNDELSLEECGSLVLRLADCAFPFQCAHGRPSMVPIVNLGAGFVPSSDSTSSDLTLPDDFNRPPGEEHGKNKLWSELGKWRKDKVRDR